MMRFDNEISYKVFQRKCDGSAEVAFSGDFLAEQPGVPYLRVVSETNGQVVFAQVLPNEARWRQTLKLPAGLYRVESGTLLEMTGWNPQYLGRGEMQSHVAVGEVYVVAGQSNAAGYGVHNIAHPQDAPAVGVHRYADGKWNLAAHPIGQLKTGPAADLFNCGHSAWLSFGRMLLDDGIPAGLVPAAKNGSSMDDWMPDGALYHNLVELMRATDAANLIWMQGCSDVHEGRFEKYGHKLESFFEHLLADISIRNVTLIQISGKKKTESFLGWKTVREQQRQAARRFGFTLIPTYDLGDYADDIHLSNRSNLLLAERVYRSMRGRNGPELLEARRCGKGAQLIFTAPLVDESQIVLFDGNFQVLPCDRVWHGAKLILTPIGDMAARFVSTNVGVQPLGTPMVMPTADFFIDLAP